MPSPIPSTSSTLNSDLPSAISLHPLDSTHSSPTNQEELVSEIQTDIQELKSQGIHYAGDENLTSQCEFKYDKNIKGEMLVAKDTKNEFILCGVFEIDARSYFMTSDGKWNASNTAGTRFDQARATCQLLPTDRDSDLSFSKQDFPTIITNLHAIETLANPKKSRDTFSNVQGESPQTNCLRLTHHLFVVCHPPHSNNSLLLNFFLKNRKRIKSPPTTITVAFHSSPQLITFSSLFIRIQYKRLARTFGQRAISG
jgi:hypothetical protein